MQKTKNEGDGYAKPITPKWVSGINSPITAWAVEIDGNFDDMVVMPTRAIARQIRNQLVKYDPVITKATTRKVILQVVPGR